MSSRRLGNRAPTQVNRLKGVHRKTEGSDLCRRCKYLDLCHGGCPKFRMNGLDKELEICTPRKFNLVEMIRRHLW